MNKKFTLLLLFFCSLNLLFGNGDDPIVTLCSGKKMSWEEYLLTKEMLTHEYDIEIDYISANDDFVSFTPAMINNSQGAWSSVIDMPLVAAGMANLPDGKVLIWSARDKLSFGGNQGKTWTAVYDPVTDNVSEFLIDNTSHDMFCPGVSTLPDGSIMVTGGSSSNKSSIYDPYTGDWSTGGNMNIARGYHANVTLSSGATFVIGGSWSGGVGNKHAEIWTEKSGWFRLPGVPVDVITDGTNSTQNPNNDDYFPWLWAAPNGKLFHAGPSQTMHWIDTDGIGSWTSAGQRSDDPYSASGTTVMYDVGKILKVGGAPTMGGGTTANDRAYTIDINSDNPVVNRVGDLSFSRNVHNSVVLPTGEVLVIGGVPAANFFSDLNARFTPELWNPETGEWTSMTDMAIPRNYHSTAVLMKDGRVMSAGGGLCGGCSANHPDAQIFSPPYLFNSNGTLATRPVITSFPASVDYNSSTVVNTNSNISSFVMIRLSGTTHSTNNDQRRIPVTFSAIGNNQYQLDIPNRNILPPGNYMLFAMNNNGTPSVAEMIRVGEDINECTPETNPDLGGTGLSAKYYNNIDLTNLANEQVDPTVNFNYGNGSPAANMDGNTFSMRWEGSVKVPRGGAYTFYTNSDDGVRLWVDGKPMVDNWTNHGATEDKGIIVLEAGQEYPIRLEYFENGGAAVIQLSWSGPGVEKQIIPQGNLFPFYFGVDQNTRIGNGPWIEGNEVTICEGQTAYFDYSGGFGNGWSFNYIRPDGAWNSVNPNSDNLGIDVLKIGPPFSTDNHPNEGTWTVEITNPDGYTITQNFTINITPGPEFECEFNIDNTGWFVESDCTIEICEGQALNFSSPGCNADWRIDVSGPNGYNETEIGGCHNFLISNNANSNIAGTYTATLTKISTGCSTTTDFNVVINSNPDVLCFFNVGDGWEQVCEKTVCTENPVTLSAHPAVNGNTWSWSGPNGFSANTRTVNLTGSASASISGEYIVTYTNENGCTGSNTLTLTVDGGCVYCPTTGEACNDNNVCTINDTYDEDCNCIGTVQDSDGDGVCDANDICDGGDDNIDVDNDNIPDACDDCVLAGQSCDDNDLCTINDVYDEACNCAGVFQDSDGDDVCDADDICNGGDDNIDVDNDGLPDACDDCIVAGQSCNDNNACTVNDTYDDDCNCIGTVQDSDGDGVCDAEDICDGGDDNIDVDNDGLPDACDDCIVVGQFCNDNNPCTINDSYDEECNCVGVFQDSDADGVCDAEDICEGGDDNIDVDNDGTPDACDNCVVVGQSCNDNNPCTINDVYDEACNCVGVFQDSDNDGVCDAEDICEGGDDNEDSDEDGIPDACDVVIDKPTQSNTVLIDEVNGKSWVVNPDNNTVTAVELSSLTKSLEINVGEKPTTLAQAPDGSIWVVNQLSHSISVLNPLNGAIQETIVLPRGTDPYAIIFSIEGDYAYVSLETVGQVLKINTDTKSITDNIDVGPDNLGIVPRVRGLAMTPDNRLLVTRFISNNPYGEVYEVNPIDMTLVRTFNLANDPEPDGPNGGRGIPNYMSSIVVSPDGTSAWIPSKKDNINRGLFRDGLVLTHDNTVRAIISQIDLVDNEEFLAGRIDFNDREMAVAATFSPAGDIIFVALQGNNSVQIVNALTGAIIGEIPVGAAPQGLIIDEQGRLFVQNFLDRSLSVIDVSAILNNGGDSYNSLAEIDLVSNELLSSQELLGKQIFYNAASPQMSLESYMSCASCHLEGGQDGQVWDFTDRGEGLRNTAALRGRGNNNHGKLHWSANFNEIQDFESVIRLHFGGTGFMSDTDFIASQNPLGNEPAAGKSEELDAIAAYINSLSEKAESPYREEDGSLTAIGALGKQVFIDNNCASCHGGEVFTDSPSGLMHDIGTIKPGSGMRLGYDLKGIDSPTLRELWLTAPYLHDGSATTLVDAINAHNNVSLSDTEVNQLAAYLKQIDDNESEITGGVFTLDIIQPLDNSIFNENDIIVLDIETTISDITEVVYYANGLEIGSASSGPYQTGWINPPIGEYEIFAKVFYGNENIAAISNPVCITVLAGPPCNIGQSCNDNDDCTINDVFDEDCNCVGVFQDSDNDGICDLEDICEGGDDNLDSDEDGIPDFCDTDVENPAVTLSTASFEVTEAFELRVDFDVDMTNLSIDDFEITNGTLQNDLSNVGTSYYVSVVPTSTGLVSIQLPANSASDIDGNGNLMSNILEVNYTAPTINNPTALLSTASFEVTEAFELRIDFDVEVSGLNINDFEISNGTLQNDLSNVGTSYYVSVVPTSTGLVIVQLPANSASDIDGSGNLISNILEVNYTGPTIGSNPIASLSTASLEVEEAFEIRIDFDTEVSGVSIEDFEISNGTLQNDLSNVGTSYYVSVKPTNTGIVSIILPADRVEDNNGNGNLISNLLKVTYTNPEDDQTNVSDCEDISNLALNGIATQSSVYNGGGGEAALAIDGITSGEWFADFSISSTGFDMNPFWEVDLGGSFNIEDVNIWNRTDCCTEGLSDYYILVSEQPFVSDNLDEVLAQSGVISLQQTEVAGTPSVISVGVSGRFIRIQRNGAGLLALAEVEVMGCSTINNNNTGNFQGAYILPQTGSKGIDAVLYPNPVEKYVFVKYEVVKGGEMRYFIADTRGVIFKETFKQIESGNDIIFEDISELPAGYYVFYIQIDGFKYIERPFVKIRD